MHQVFLEGGNLLAELELMKKEGLISEIPACAASVLSEVLVEAESKSAEALLESTKAIPITKKEKKTFPFDSGPFHPHKHKD